MTTLIAATFARINWTDVALILLLELGILLRFVFKAAIILVTIAAAVVMIVLTLIFAQRLPRFIRRHF